MNAGAEVSVMCHIKRVDFGWNFGIGEEVMGGGNELITGCDCWSDDRAQLTFLS